MTDPKYNATKTFNMVIIPLLLYTLVSGLYSAYKPGKWVWFSYHPLSMMVAFVGLASFAILKKKIGGYDNTKLHGYVMFAAAILAVFGFYVIYVNKGEKPHFVTVHAKLGLAVVLGYLSVSPMISLLLDPAWGIAKTNKDIRYAHKISGRALTALAWMCCYLGFITMEKDIMYQILFAVPLLVFAYFVLL
jgi:uncharacterized membrane protein